MSRELRIKIKEANCEGECKADGRETFGRVGERAERQQHENQIRRWFSVRHVPIPLRDRMAHPGSPCSTEPSLSSSTFNYPLIYYVIWKSRYIQLRTSENEHHQAWHKLSTEIGLQWEQRNSCNSEICSRVFAVTFRSFSSLHLTKNIRPPKYASSGSKLSCRDSLETSASSSGFSTFPILLFSF